MMKMESNLKHLIFRSKLNYGLATWNTALFAGHLNVLDNINSS